MRFCLSQFLGSNQSQFNINLYFHIPSRFLAYDIVSLTLRLNFTIVFSKLNVSLITWNKSIAIPFQFSKLDSIIKQWIVKEFYGYIHILDKSVWYLEDEFASQKCHLRGCCRHKVRDGLALQSVIVHQTSVGELRMRSKKETHKGNECLGFNRLQRKYRKKMKSRKKNDGLQEGFTFLNDQIFNTIYQVHDSNLFTQIYLFIS